MTKKKIRVGFLILKHYRDKMEVLLRALRLLYPEEMSGNEWRGPGFVKLIDLCSELIPASVLKLARDEPAELERRMRKLEKKKGRTLSHTSQLQAIRRWRGEMSEDAQEIVEKANLAAVIEETKPVEMPAEKPPVEEKPVVKEKLAPKIDIKGIVEGVLLDFKETYNPKVGELPFNAIVTDDIVYLRTQMISAWGIEGYLMRITAKASEQTCWAWIRGDYEFKLPSELTVEEIGDFGDLTDEENGHVE